MTDVLRAAFEEAGHVIEIKMFPYARAVAAVSSGEYDGIVIAGKEFASTLVYPDIPTASQKVTFSVMTGTTWRYTGIESLTETSVGIVKGYDYGNADLNQYLKEQADSDRVVVLHGLNTTERALKMLLTNRIGTYIDGEYSILYSAKKMGIRDKVFIAGYAAKQFDDYTGFSPHHPKAIQYAKLLTDKIKELKQSGELSRIIGRYGIHSE